MKSNQEKLEQYLPENSVLMVLELLDKYPCQLKIVNNRKTKHGDFRKFPNGMDQITINNDLNRYRFLLTLIHELAHLMTYKSHKNVKPHGREWKINFQHLMLPFVNPNVYPRKVLPFLANYLINPRASTDSHINLSLALKVYDKKTNLNFIFEIPLKSKFIHNDRIFQRGAKRRTRFECIEVKSNKKYLFHHNAEVELLRK